MNIVTRAQAGLRPPKYINRGPMLAQSTCHYNGPDITVGGSKTWDHSKCAGLVRGIQNYHMDGKGWSDIAYNFMICPHGYTFEGRGLNTYNGANGTTSGNKSSHAIMCLAGEGNTFTDAEKIEFRQCVEYVVEKTKCNPGCMGHRDHKSTACPGNIRYKWVHAGMPVSNSGPVVDPIDEGDGLVYKLAWIKGSTSPGKLYRVLFATGKGGKLVAVEAYNVSTDDPMTVTRWRDRLDELPPEEFIPANTFVRIMDGPYKNVN